MFDLPDKYKVSKKIPLKDFIQKDFKPEIKKKIKDNVKSVYIDFQIFGEDIPSIVDSEYNYQVIQFYSFEIKDIKKANFIADIYQQVIKAPCVIRLYDNKNEVYSFAIKRLNQNDKTEIVITDKFLSKIFPLVIPSIEKTNFLKELSYKNIKNNTDKLCFYIELYLKSYIIKNEKLYINIKSFLNKPIWYDKNKMLEVYYLLYELSKNKENIEKINTNSEKIKFNQNIRELISKLDKI